MKALLKIEESGFTLLEALIAIMVSSVTLLFICTSIQQLHQINELIIVDAQVLSPSKTTIKGSRQIEWHLFLTQLERCLEETELISSTSSSITVKDRNAGNIETKYGRSRSGYRSFYRSKNNGHNIMLTEINRFYIDIDEQWLLLDFIFQNGETYKGRIWVESWKTTSS